MTITLSSSQRSPQMAELSSRHGTSRTLNRVWPDHPYSAEVLWTMSNLHYSQTSRVMPCILLRSKLCFTSCTSCHGGECNTPFYTRLTVQDSSQIGVEFCSMCDLRKYSSHNLHNTSNLRTEIDSTHLSTYTVLHLNKTVMIFF